MNMRSKSVLTWGIVIVAVVGIVYGLIELAKTSPTNQGGAQAGTGLIPPIASSDWTEGDPNATTTLIEYGDFECPVCAVYAPVLDQLMKDFNGKIYFAYRYFPLETIHPNAALSAAAAEAAGAQGKFWQMHDLLFQDQNTWSGESPADAEKTFETYASQLGLNAGQFSADMNSATTTSKIQGDYENDLKMGLTYTPTFIVNGKIIQNPTSYDAFKQIIQQSLGGQ